MHVNANKFGRYPTKHPFGHPFPAIIRTLKRFQQANLSNDAFYVLPTPHPKPVRVTIQNLHMCGLKGLRQGFYTGFWMLYLMIAAPLQAQQTLDYKGDYRVGAYSGEASFSYTIKEGDTVLQGPFRMEKSDLGALLETGDKTFAISGTFLDNKPAGAWRFRFGEFKTDSLSQLDGLQYQVKVSGRQHEAIGVMREGQPDGLWTHTVSLIRSSQLEKTLFRSSIRFDQGVPQKSFRIEAGEYTLVGRILRNGLAHDEWTLYSDRETGPVENWIFSEGKLLSIELLKDSGTQQHPIFGQDWERSRSIPLDTAYLALLEWYSYPDSTTSVSSRLLKENASYYRDIDQILSSLGDAQFRPGFEVLVPFYPMDTTRVARWSKLCEQVRRAKTLNDEILQDPQLQIVRRSDTEAQTLYARSSRIYTSLTRPLGYIGKLRDQGLLEYVKRDEILARLWPGGVPVLPVRAGEDEALMPNDVPQRQPQENSLEALEQLASYAVQELESIKEQLGPRLALQKQQREQARLEEGLISQLDELSAAWDSTAVQRDPDVREAITALRREAERLVSEYSGLPPTAEKTERARQIASCLARFIQLEQVLRALPDQWETIRNAYTDQIWNPFTATIMDESVKRRITTAYRDVLIPYVLEAIRLQPDCKQVENWLRLLETAPPRILELRDSDTSRLERKLRREKDPIKVIELLGLKPAGNEK